MIAGHLCDRRLLPEPLACLAAVVGAVAEAAEAEVAAVAEAEGNFAQKQ